MLLSKIGPSLPATTEDVLVIHHLMLSGTLLGKLSDSVYREILVVLAVIEIWSRPNQKKHEGI